MSNLTAYEGEVTFEAIDPGLLLARLEVSGPSLPRATEILLHYLGRGNLLPITPSDGGVKPPHVWRDVRVARGQSNQKV